MNEIIFKKYFFILSHEYFGKRYKIKYVPGSTVISIRKAFKMNEFHSALTSTLGNSINSFFIHE